MGPKNIPTARKNEVLQSHATVPLIGSFCVERVLHGVLLRGVPDEPGGGAGHSRHCLAATQDPGMDHPPPPNLEQKGSA